ncbi:outer membrane lipoprotein SlyB [Humitalea rosea]|uniref:17 kDa surface antigen n=1 Tax=Humitalea rosea TaxID=990373 RepID=A0A2W7IIM6_9PROT|nr:glycine zipper 2TM domain-containing protein [Humitalea rosea]PZW45868.1 outer membrane lipoprotein SlyB [Humitalea rosea]
MFHFRASAPLRALAVVLVLGGGLAACAPQNTGSTYSAGSLGRAASISYGTIVGVRPVQVAGSQSGLGALGGAAAGGVAGSFVGGDWRSRALMGLGGAVVGGLAGNAIEGGVTRGSAVEFVVREDRGGDIAVVQTNEEGLQAGDRVVINRGDRTRLSRAAGNAPPPAGAYNPTSGGAAYGAPVYNK